MNSMRKFGVGVIGAGFWGKNHIWVFSNPDHVKLLAICDTDSHRARDFGKKYQIQPFTNVEGFLKREGIETISTCTPTTTHYQIAFRAIERGRHVFIEKPMVSTSEKAKRLIAKAEKRSLHLTVGFIERFNPDVLRVTRALREVVLAFEKRVERWPERIGDVGVVEDTAIHDLDLMRFIFEQEPQSFYVRMGSLDQKFEDYCHIVLSFNGIQTGFVEENWLTPHKIRTLTMTGEEAVAS